MGNLFDRIVSDPSVFIASLALLLSVTSIFVAAISLIIQRQHNRKSVMPIGKFEASDYEDSLSVTIKNSGVGPLIIESVEISQPNGQSTDNLIEVMPNMPSSLCWSGFACNLEGDTVLPGEELELLKLEGHPSDPEFAQFRDQVRKKLSSLVATLEYKDIYGTKMPGFQIELSWFGRNIEFESDIEVEQYHRRRVERPNVL